MKRIVGLLLILFLITSCISNTKSIKDLKSEYVTMNDSVSIHYKTYGDGDKTICFVHGFGCDLNTWEKQFEGLHNDDNFRLVFIDLPGYGESSKPHVDYTLDFFAQAVNKVLDENRVGPVTLVGHSLGTPVCRHTLMNYHIGDLVDVDGVYCFYDGTETPEYVEAVQQFGHAFDGPNCEEVITGFVMSLAGPDTPQEITDYAISVMPKTPQYVASSTMRNLVERQWWPDKPFEGEAMVVCTQNSGLDPDNRQKMERLYPNLDYTEFTTCGHFVHMEWAEMFNEKLKQFVLKETTMNTELKPFDVQKDFADNGFTFFTKNLILCSGDTTENNAMTIGWGSIGNYIGHNRPTVTVYVAPARYTWEFMERHGRFTIMEFEDPEVWKYMGRNSGRFGDKATALGLHIAYTENGTPYYEEAKLVIECEIMTSWHQNENDFRNATPKDWYADFDAGIHTVYIGEVIGAWRR